MNNEGEKESIYLVYWFILISFKFLVFSVGVQMLWGKLTFCLKDITKMKQNAVIFDAVVYVLKMSGYLLH
jgi:hypothetical protein